jgi:hypothetical protein
MSLEVAYGELHTCSSRDHEACETRPAYRPPTREDVLAAVRELGGVEVWWCAVLPPDGGTSALWGCRQRIAPSVHHDCGPRLVVSLDTGDTEPALCPVCKDDPGEMPCLTCMNTGLVDTGDTE